MNVSYKSHAQLREEPKMISLHPTIKIFSRSNKSLSPNYSSGLQSKRKISIKNRLLLKNNPYIFVQDSNPENQKSFQQKTKFKQNNLSFALKRLKQKWNRENNVFFQPMKSSFKSPILNISDFYPAELSNALERVNRIKEILNTIEVVNTQDYKKSNRRKSAMQEKEFITINCK